MTVELPIPLSRTEIYLAAAAGMTGLTLPEPENREECYLAYIAGYADVDVPMPASLKEEWLYLICGGVINPMPEIEGSMLIGQQMVNTNYLAAAAGVNDAILPDAPRNRAEEYFVEIASRAPFWRLKTVSGVSLALTDVKQGIESLNYFKGDTTQITYSGKNFFRINNPSTNLATYAVIGDTVVVTCTGGTGTSYLRTQIPVQENTTYTVSVDLSGDFNTDPPGPVRISEVINGQIQTSSVVSNFSEGYNTGTFTTSVGTTALNIYMRPKPRTEGAAIMLTKFQLEKGSTATTYEPYVGGIPSPNPDYPQTVNTVTGRQVVTISDGGGQSQEYEVNLGKNLYNKNSGDILNAYTNGSTGLIASSDINRLIWVECKPNTIYTVSKIPTGRIRTVGTTSVLPAVGVAYTYMGDCPAGTIGGGRVSLTFTTPADAKYIVWRVYNTNQDAEAGSLDDILNSAQIEEGSTATAYAPYFIPIELCKIGEYRDYIYKSGDDWYLHKATGKDTLPTSGYYIWETHMDACMYYRNYEVPGALFQNDSTALKCRDFVCKAQIPNMTEYYNRYHNDGYGITLKTQTHGIGIQNIKQTTLTDFHNWIRDNPITIYYALATTTDTQITNTALVEQLNTLDAAVLPSPNADVTVTGDIAGAIDFSYYATP